MTLQMNRDERAESLRWLAATVVITIVIWGTPWGFLLYPFTLLATWFHEMGHGLAAMLVGAEFEQLVIFPGGSGYANILRPVDMGASASAFISAGGPLAPAIAGGLLIAASRWRRASRWALVLLAAVLLVSLLAVVRGTTGWLVLPLISAAILAIARYAPVRPRQFALQFLGLQACISTYTNLGYLFSRGGVMAGRLQPSDTEQMARALWLPYWAWGGLLTLAIAAIVAASLYAAYRR